MPEELKNFIEENKKQYLQILWHQKELEYFLKGREEVKTEEVLSSIIENTNSLYFKEVAEILLSNKKIIQESTILRGKTFDWKAPW